MSTIAMEEEEIWVNYNKLKDGKNQKKIIIQII